MVETPAEGADRRVSRLWTVAAVCLCLLAPVESKAADVYVIRFLIVLNPGECPGVSIYRDQLFFRNTTAQDLTVRALGGSNGYQPPADPLVVPAGKSRSISIEPFAGLGGSSNRWTPVAPYVFMVNRLDAPDGIIAESRGEMLGKGLITTCSSFDIGTEVFGSFPLPLVRVLTPANVPEFHLDSELGTGASVTNVGVYNGGSAPAMARIDIRAACDDRLLESRAVSVAPATLIYATGFRNTYSGTACASGQTAANYSRYVVVTMDQPGFSFVLARSEVQPPALPISSSLSR